MTVVSINQRLCEHYRQNFDACLDNELPAEDRRLVMLHVCSCSDCAEILDSRARMKHLLRNAVASEEVPEGFMKVLRSRFRTRPQSSFSHDNAG